MPAPGSIGYLRSSPDDAKNAAERLRNGELVAGTSATSAAVPVDDHRDHRPGLAVDDHGAGRRPRRPVETTAPVDTAPVEAPVAPAAQPAGDRHGRDRGGGRRSVNLIDRRVGLLFAAFVVFLGLVLVRAVWVQGVTGGTLSAEAQSQQIETVEVPGSRGTIYDRTGRELAVSEDAATVFATPYQVEDPAATAHKLGKVLDLDQDEILKAISDRESGFAYIARKVDLVDADEDQRARPAGDRAAARQPPHLPAGRARRAGDRHGRDRQPGPDRARGLRGRAPARRPTASAR